MIEFTADEAEYNRRMQEAKQEFEKPSRLGAKAAFALEAKASEVFDQPITIEDQHPLIGIGGLKESGKDTVADRLVDIQGFQKAFMSAPLEKSIYIMNPLIIIDVAVHNVPRVGTWSIGDIVEYRALVDHVGYTAAKQQVKVREWLQHFGTEVGREIIGEDTWVDIAKRTIQEFRKTSPVVITGIRFDNEIKMINDLGGTLVYVDRPSKASGSPSETVTPEKPENVSTTASHASESTLDETQFEYVIHNTGTLDDLYRYTDSLWEILK